MKPAGTLLAMLWLSSSVLVAQAPAPNAPPPKAAEDYSGMYTFLREGEFVQINQEEGRVSGFVSRYGEGESDQGAFLDQFFKQGKLEGKKLTFSTETVHGVWYEFKGTVERGEGKNVGDDSYYVLKGTLKQYTIDAEKKTSAKSREVVFKAFPQDLGADPAKPQ